MRLARLTQLESKKLVDELEALRDRIEELRHLVEEDSARRDLLRAELRELEGRYGDDRRTEILDESEPFPLPSGEGGESSLVMVSRLGYVKAQAVRAGTGAMAGAEAMAEREGDFVRQVFVARGSARALLFTARGNAHSVSVKDLPRGSRSSRGKQLSDLIELAPGDRIVSVVPVADFEGERYLLFVTRSGQVKRTPLQEYSNVRGSGIKATGVGRDDEVFNVMLTSGAGDVLVACRSGLAIRFAEDDIRPMGRTARGVKGMELAKGDELIGAAAPRRDADILLVTTDGFGKRMPFTELRRQGRAGKGVTVMPERDRCGDLIGLLEVHPGDRVVCELGSGDVVALTAEVVPTKARRGAGVSIRELASRARAGPVAGLHPLRATASPADSGAGPKVVDETAAFAPTSTEETPVSAEDGSEAAQAHPLPQGELDLRGG
jgi:DNA gyrase subunit A